MPLARICCVHQGHEMYGSDRSFVETVQALRTTYPDASIEVVIPAPGPILPALQKTGVEVVIDDLWVLRRRNLLRLVTLGLVTFPLAVLRALRRFRRADLVYINTAVVADHIVAARWARTPAVLHIHEIAGGTVGRILRGLALWSRARIVFNSQATRAAYDLPAEVPARVIYNGIAGPSGPEPMTYDGTRPLRVLLLGRISRIKGQDVLVEALRQLAPGIRDRVEVRIVGSAYQDPAREAALAEAVRSAGLAGQVTLSPFVDDPSPLYGWADIVVVPSCLPESLGRVAIEGMAHGRPALVSAIGGLTEVVEHGVTGWHVPPGDAASLARTLADIVMRPEAWRSFPARARARYEALFTEAAARRTLASLMRDIDAPGLLRAPAATTEILCP